MHQYGTYPDLLHYLERRLKQFEEKMLELEEENEQLREKLKDIKPINVENINYKIQELSVKELPGTLNIGMSALGDLEQLKKLAEEAEDLSLEDLEQGDSEEDF